MTGLIRRAALLSAIGLVAANAAMAGIPSAAFSSIGSSINVGGHAGGPSILATDPASATKMWIRDAQPAAVAVGTQVTINFTACTDMNLTVGQAGLICGSRTVSALTIAQAGTGTAQDPFYNVIFNISGAGRTSFATDATPGEGCATVVAGSVPLGNISVGMPDLNGARGAGGTCAGTDCGVDGTDTSQYINSRFPSGAPNPNYKPRVNYVFTAPPQSIDGLDTSKFTTFRFGGESGTNGPFCNP